MKPDPLRHVPRLKDVCKKGTLIAVLYIWTQAHTKTLIPPVLRANVQREEF